MRITDLLEEQCICLDSAPATKAAALEEAVALMAKSGRLRDVEQFRTRVYAREAMGTTGVGGGIAIPHGKCQGVARPGLAAMVIRDGVDFAALDGAPVTLLFLIAAPETGDNVHLEVLSRLSALMMNKDCIRALTNARTAVEFLAVVEQFDVSPTEQESTSNPREQYILAVTACPTGIAHTYMAAKGLEQGAAALGCHLKVETRGAVGTRNPLTAEDIARADCIIVAADTAVPMERFAGKPLLRCPVSEGISRGEALVREAIAGNAPIYRPGRSAGEEAAPIGPVHKLYTALMSGVTYALPFGVVGGVLLSLRRLLGATPWGALLGQVGEETLSLFLPVLAAFLAMAIGDRPAFVVGLMGGLWAAQGQSGFLGALAAGLVAGYLVLGLKKLFRHIPAPLEGLVPVLICPVLGLLLLLPAMMWGVEPVLGAVRMFLDRSFVYMPLWMGVPLGAVLGGMMAWDMGGPLNKAAYVLGLAAVSAGHIQMMAAVMVGGMVPPCALALASLVFPQKFTRAERADAPKNLLLGLAFVTEGAIPFVRADPCGVLPPCVAGSALAGALSMVWGCGLMVPHGGIFVFPLADRPLAYLASLVVGTAAAGLLLGLMKGRKRSHNEFSHFKEG